MNKLEFYYSVDLKTKDSTWIGYCGTFEKAEEEYALRIKHDTIDSQKVDKVIMEKMGGIYIGKSKYQAEQALIYLKINYPNYNNHHISGTGAWDDPYLVFMSKVIRTYDMWTKQELISKTDYN